MAEGRVADTAFAFLPSAGIPDRTPPAPTVTVALDHPTRRKQQMFVGCQILDVNRTIVGPHLAATLLILSLNCIRHCFLPSPSRSFPRVLIDEIRHARNALLDRFVRGGVAEADVLAFVRDARAEVDIRQYGNAGFLQKPLAKLLRVRRADQLAGFGDVWPRVEGAAGILANHSRHLAEQANDQIAA